MATDPRVLSLEDLCLLRLICHLEDFPPEALASLSIPVRRRLLQNLPAVDVCQLEGTAVTEDINMELSVWKELCRERTDGEEVSSCYMQLYFDNVYKNILNGDLTRASCQLFSIRACLGISNWAGLHHSFASVELNFPTPCRHAMGFTKEHLMTHLISVVIHKCKRWPENIKINCNKFFQLGSWDRRGLVFSTFLRASLEKVKSVKFVEVAEDPLVYSIPQFFLEVIFARCQVSLQAFSLDGPYGFLKVALASGRLFFSQSSSHSEDQYLQQSLDSRALPSVPFSGLSSIHIIGEGDLEQGESIPLQKDLESIVAYQNSLTSVDLSCFSFSATPACSLIRSLGSLFHQRQFLYLRLSWIELGMKELGLLIHDLLASPTSQDHSKTLCIEYLDFNRNFSEMSDFIYHCPVALGPPDRVLSLTVSDDGAEIGDLFRWLSHYPYSRLQSFSFTFDGFQLKRRQSRHVQ